MMKSDVAVLGAGFSSVATIVNLIDTLPPAKSIGVAGQNAGFGLGRAYSTEDAAHRLNVPAGRMSLHPDRPDHLVEWLERRNSGLGKEDFIPRQVYGRYIKDSLASSLHEKDNRARVTFSGTEAIDCERLDQDRQIFRLANGETLEARHTVFCLGGTPAGLPVPAKAIEPAARARISMTPFEGDWLSCIDANDTILLLGSGLTMIDQVISLKHRGHHGAIHVLSRHGLVPHTHRVPRAEPVAPPFTPGSRPLSAMLHLLRDAARSAEDWRRVIDGLRPMTQALWQNLSAEERLRFLRHANAWWSVHRHRMAPEIAAVFDDMRRSGQISIHKGWLQAIRERDGRAVAFYKDRHDGIFRQIAFDHLVNCTGMERCSISKVPLLKKMSARGMIASDPLGLGLAVNSHSQLLTPGGGIQQNSYAMGPMAAGQFFEIFAVPDIRVQARNVAERIAAAA